jgi:hypothetical protein
MEGIAGERLAFLHIQLASTREFLASKFSSGHQKVYAF